MFNRGRRVLNLSDVFGSATSAPAYDRIASQPVFSVTTPWGSPYLLFERTDRAETFLEFDDDLDQQDASSMTNVRRKEDNKPSQVALYFLDEEDALRLRDEMMQMEQMKGADMRVTAFSLSKAMSQAVNLKKGLLTGQPIDVSTGKSKSPDEGGSLRYKIVPPKRELFYAARCKGRQRVGLWSADPKDDARLMLNGLPAIGGTLALARKGALERRRRDSRSEVDSNVDPMKRDYGHMEGFVGVPVFHCPEMKKMNKVKGILRNNNRAQSPLYFSYEDLMESWEGLRAKTKKEELPKNPEVEVYNLMDVVTSIDRDQWRTKRGAQLRRDALLSNITSKFSGKSQPQSVNTNNVPSGLEQVVFVPSSKTAKFKETISKVGTCQARGLRPMRPWGKDTM